MNPVSQVYDLSRCVICYDDFEKDKKNACLGFRCGHIFHEICATEWLIKNPRCPLCNRVSYPPLTFQIVLKEAVHIEFGCLCVMTTLFMTYATFIAGVVALILLMPQENRSTFCEAYPNETLIQTDETGSQRSLYIFLLGYTTIMTFLLGRAAFAAASGIKTLSEKSARRLDYIPL